MMVWGCDEENGVESYELLVSLFPSRHWDYTMAI